MVRRQPPARPARSRASIAAVLSLFVLGMTGGATVTAVPDPHDHAGIDQVAGIEQLAGAARADEAVDEVADEAVDEGASVPWLSIVIVLVALVALFVLARVLLRPRAASTSRATSGATSIGDAFRALGDAQWVHDQVSLDVLGGAAEGASARWAAQRPVVDGIVRDALRRGSRDPRSGWNELAASVAAVQRALDAVAAARSDSSTDPTVVAESVAAVERARAQLLAQIDQVRRQV